MDGAWPETHDDLRRLDAPLVVVRDDELVTVAGYTAAWAEMLGWGADEHVGRPSLEIGFLPDYVEGNTKANLAELHERLELLASLPSFSRPIEHADGREVMFDGFCTTWHLADRRHYVFVQLALPDLDPQVVIDRVELLVDSLPWVFESHEEVPVSDDSSETRTRLTVRIDRPVAAAVQQLAREEGVSLNALVQAVLEGITGSHRIEPTDVSASSIGYVVAAARALGDREVKRARWIDYDRRNTGRRE